MALPEARARAIMAAFVRTNIASTCSTPPSGWNAGLTEYPRHVAPVAACRQLWAEFSHDTNGGARPDAGSFRRTRPPRLGDVPADSAHGQLPTVARGRHAAPDHAGSASGWPVTVKSGQPPTQQ